jgi:hypothetical protein
MIVSVYRRVILGVAAAGAAGVAMLFAGAPAVAYIAHPLVGSFGSLASPRGIAVDSANGNVFVDEEGGGSGVSGVVVVLGPGGGAPAGGAPAQISGAGTPSGGFFDAAGNAGVAVDDSGGPSNGDVYVADPGDNAVDKFKLGSSGKYEYVCRFTGFTGAGGVECLQGTLAGPEYAFSAPRGVAVDPAGNVFVSDAANSAVYEFNSGGEAVGLVEPEDDFLPESIASGGADGYLYLLQQGSGRVAERPEGLAGEEFHVTPYGTVATAVAANPRTGEAYVDLGSYIGEYNAEPEEPPVRVSEFGAKIIEGSTAIAVDGTTGDSYALSEGKIYQFEAPANLARVTTGAVSSLGSASATVAGTVDPEEIGATSCAVEYGTGGSYDQSVACTQQDIGSGGQTVQVSATIHGLEPNTTYSYRFAATNQNGTNYGSGLSLAIAAAPDLSTQPASAADVTPRGATLIGAINPLDAITGYHFVYGTSTAYGSIVPQPDLYLPANDVEDPVVPQTITGLTPGTTYHFALVAISPGGNLTGPDETFTTPAIPSALVSTAGASEVGLSTATVSGAVNPQGQETTYQFQYGPTTVYGSSWPTVAIELGALPGPQSVLVTLQNLQPNTVYHYRLIATNAAGTSYGADQTFTTPEYPASLIQATPLTAKPIAPAKQPTKATTKKKAKKKKARKGKAKKRGKNGKAKKK